MPQARDDIAAVIATRPTAEAFFHSALIERATNNNDGAAIGLASAIGAAMKAGAASARGIRCAEACERAGDQNCCEKVLHVFSRFLAAGRHGLYPSNGDLNGE